MMRDERPDPPPVCAQRSVDPTWGKRSRSGVGGPGPFFFFPLSSGASWGTFYDMESVREGRGKGEYIG